MPVLHRQPLLPASHLHGCEEKLMSLAQAGIAAFSDHMPKVISPKAHAIADCAIIGGFAVLGAVLWKRNRRAAIAALGCAGAQTVNTLLTDHPAGIADAITPAAHRRIDVALAAASSTIPSVLGFAGEPEGRYFRLIGLCITAVGATSDFGQSRSKPFLRKSA
jgi:hypothetical protein